MDEKDADVSIIATQQLLTDISHCISSSNHVLTATDVYRIGLLMYSLHKNHHHPDHQHVANNVQAAARAVLQGLPVNIRQGLFDELQEALQLVIDQQEPEEENLTRALESFVGIWSFLLVDTSTTRRDDGANHTTRHRRISLGWPREVEVSQCFIDLYQKPNVQNSSGQSALVLEFLSLVWLSPIEQDNSNDVSSSSSKHLEDFLTVVNALQEQDTNLWQDLIKYHEQYNVLGSSSRSSWRRDLVTSLTETNTESDATQRDYLSSILMYEKTPETRSMVMPSSSTTTTRPPNKGVSAKKIDPMQERIDQVRAVIPNVGEGFVELALSLYQGNVERAISALLEPDDQLPPGLQYVDKQLPRRKNPNVMTLDDEDAKVAKQVTKQALLAEEQRLKAEAAALIYVSKTEENTGAATIKRAADYHNHDEYDDEYDDQWDDLGGTTAGADDGLYDRLDSGGGSRFGSSNSKSDYEAILVYNRAMKQVEGEQSFWDEQRNTNRASKTTSAASADGETSYRGPDKMRGGRVPGRGGGRGGRGNKDNDAVPGTPATAGGGRGHKNQGKADSAKSTTSSNANNNDKPSKPNQRHKANKLASRREQQKQSMNKRSGVM